MKKALNSCTTLRYFEVTKPVTIECDATKDGLGVYCCKKTQPVAYASRGRSAAEQSYAQIEKENTGNSLLFKKDSPVRLWEKGLRLD